MRAVPRLRLTYEAEWSGRVGCVSASQSLRVDDDYRLVDDQDVDPFTSKFMSFEVRHGAFIQSITLPTMQRVPADFRFSKVCKHW